jgi:transposase
MRAPSRSDSCQGRSGFSAQRIYQDLVEEKGFADSYESVKRFVRKLRASHPQRVWRLECQPGEELQLDFDLGGPIDQDQGKTRRSWILRMVLSYSRKGYSEAVLRQDTDTFLRCLENGLRSFGGTPLLLNLDNFKGAVRNADWFDPDINPKLADFCRHYGMHVVPCRPGKPQHKGKVERGIAYLRSNGLKGRRFRSLSEENRFLSHWESHVADKRIHGTTRKQVIALFDEERAQLQGLPDSLFPSYQEANATFTATVMSKSLAPFTKCLPNTSATRCGSGGIAAVSAFLISGWNRSRCTPELSQAALAARWVQEAYMRR